RLVQSIDPNGNATLYRYDAAGRQVEVIKGYGSAVAASTRYQFDPAGNLLSVTDPDNNTTSYTYDTLDRQRTMTDALGHTQTLAADAAGHLTDVTDRDGRRRHLTYDDEGRQTGETWYSAAGAVVDTRSFGYDSDGLLQSASNSAGTVHFTYDALGQLHTQTDT